MCAMPLNIFNFYLLRRKISNCLCRFFYPTTTYCLSIFPFIEWTITHKLWPIHNNSPHCCISSIYFLSVLLDHLPSNIYYVSAPLVYIKCYHLLNNQCFLLGLALYYPLLHLDAYPLENS